MGIDQTVTVSLEPLLQMWERINPPHMQAKCVCSSGGRCASIESLRRVLGVTRSTMQRRVVSGKITLAEADTWAVRLGLHPSRVWTQIDRAPVHASLGRRRA